MELTVIGSGTGVPSLRRGSPCLAVKAGGRLVVLDLGSGSLRALLRRGLNFSDIDVLALTHLHPDHVGDLIPFWFATRYALGYTRRQPFKLLAARGFVRFHDLLKEAFSGWVEPPAGLMDLRELSADGPDEVRGEGLVIKSAPTGHTAGSLAYRVEAEGRSLVYSGDTDVSDSLADLARGADLLVLEAANPFKVPGHLTPREAGRLAARAGVIRLVLTHFYPPCDAVDVVALAAQEFKGDILRAEDGLNLII
ncbi:MAG: ribonuclease Z [Syntrophobacterales bacterium]|jgi:ribonuclease BN (tRNA processing enzyme)|nr:ribonuclease Z [Syntrophobacterales bacterium]